VYVNRVKLYGKIPEYEKQNRNYRDYLLSTIEENIASYRTMQAIEVVYDDEKLKELKNRL
jgi:hypothetical protein